MGLILKDKIKKLQKGYPTRTAKEQVEGGVLGGTENLLPGNVVCYGAQPGEFTATFTAAKIAGFALATNVKLVTEYPGESKDAPFVPGEAINLMISGYIAVQLDASLYTIDATTKAVTVSDTLVEGANADTTDGINFKLGNTNFKNAYFTGVYEVVKVYQEDVEGTLTDKAIVLAEIKYNM